MSLTAEEIEKSFNKYRALCEKLGPRSTDALALVDGLGERLALCPASGKKDYHNAFPGGLVDHSLRVLGNAMTYVKSMGWTVPKDSLIISCLFHDLGKVGDHEKDYYVLAEDWQAKRGELYSYNREIDHMSVPHRGVFLCNHYGLKLTRDETLAILLNDGWVVEENKQYCLKEPLLAHVVMTADYVSTMQEKGRFP
jgi:hypothetical protein